MGLNPPKHWFSQPSLLCVVTGAALNEIESSFGSIRNLKTPTTCSLPSKLCSCIWLLLGKFPLQTCNYRCQRMPVSSGVSHSLAFNDRFHRSLTPRVYHWWRLTSFSRPKLWFPVQNILKQSPLSSPAIPGMDPRFEYRHGDSLCWTLDENSGNSPSHFQGVNIAYHSPLVIEP